MASTTTIATSTHLTTGPLINETAILQTTAPSNNKVNKLPPLTTKIFSPTDLLTQPWLSDLTKVVNESFYVQINNVEITATRLHSDTQISEELGERGFTVVAFAPAGDKDAAVNDQEKVEVIGTASVKEWQDDGLWVAYDGNNAQGSDHENGDNARSEGREPFVCSGDYELAIVAIRPGPKYRRRGIADYLMKLCEQEVLRRHSAKERGSYQKTSIRMMIKIKEDVTGPYWSRKGFNTVGTRRCPVGTWESTYAFDMWAMVKELLVQERTNDRYNL